MAIAPVVGAVLSSDSEEGALASPVGAFTAHVRPPSTAVTVAAPATAAETPMATVTSMPIPVPTPTQVPVRATPPAVTTEAVAATATTATTAAVRQNLVVLGDSVASGFGCDCGGFGTALAKANGPASLTNDAENGLTSEGLLAQLSSTTLDTALATATTVTVTIGANDFDESQAADASCINATCYAATLQTMTTAINQITSQHKHPVRRRRVASGWRPVLSSC